MRRLRALTVVVGACMAFYCGFLLLFWQTWREEAVLRHTHQVNTAEFSDDDHLILTACADGTVRVWDVATWACLLTLTTGTEAMTAASWSPGGRGLILAHTSGGATFLWDYVSRRRLLDVSDGSIGGAAFSATGTYFAVTRRRRDIEIWSTASLAPQTTVPSRGGDVLFYGFSPNDELMVSVNRAGGDGVSFSLWNLRSGRLIASLPPARGRLAFVLWTDDSQCLVTLRQDGSAEWWAAGDLRHCDPRDQPRLVKPRVGTVSRDSRMILRPDVQVNARQVTVLERRQPESIRQALTDPLVWAAEALLVLVIALVWSDVTR